MRETNNPCACCAQPDGPFDIVYDNNGKKLDVCRAAIDKYKVRSCLHASSLGIVPQRGHCHF